MKFEELSLFENNFVSRLKQRNLQREERQKENGAKESNVDKKNQSQNPSSQMNRRKMEEYTKYIRENFAPRIMNIKREQIKKDNFYLENIQEKNLYSKKRTFDQGVSNLRSLQHPKKSVRSREEPIVRTKFENYLGTFNRSSQVLTEDLRQKEFFQQLESLDKELQVKKLDRELHRNLVEIMGIDNCFEGPSYSQFFNRSIQKKIEILNHIEQYN